MRLLILLIGLGLPVAGLADVFQWQDADGQTHYGDNPPADALGVRQVDAGAGRLSTVGGSGLREGEQAWIDRLDEEARERASRPQVVNPPPTIVNVQPPPRDEGSGDRVVVYRDRSPYYYRPREPWLTFQWGQRPPRHPTRPIRPPINNDDRPLPWPTRPPTARPEMPKPRAIGLSD